MKISFITPVYNGSSYLTKHVESIFAFADGVYDFELIYIDNNSTDNSFEIISSISSMDNRVVCARCLKQGPASTRNVGLNAATGSIIVFLDVDDLICGEALHTQISLAVLGKASQCCVKYAGSKFIAPVWPKTFVFNFYLSFGNQVPFSSFVCPQSKIIFHEDLSTSEDWLYILENRAKFGAIHLVPEIGRIYNEDSGFSHALGENVTFQTHCIAFSRFYRISLVQSEELLNRFYFRKFGNHLHLFSVFRFFSIARYSPHIVLFKLLRILL